MMRRRGNGSLGRGIIASWVIGAALALTLLCYLALSTTQRPVPLFESPVSSILLDRDDHLLGAVIAEDGQWRFPSGSAVPEKFRTAILEFEDRRFAWHPGVDPIAIARASYQNWSEGRVVSGASTLTMQVIRLSRGHRGRTIGEKLIEMALALRLEVERGKDEILELYAENAPFGGNVVGLEAAAWRYFGRSPATLSWAEASLLAVLPNSPALMHPGRNREPLEAKRDRLLDRLHAAGRIDALELGLAKAEPLPERPQPLPRLAPHLLPTLMADAVYSVATSRTMQAPDGMELGAAARTATHLTTHLTSPPISHRFRSTLDRGLQMRAQEVISRHASGLESIRVYNVAALIVANESLEVRAYIGNSRAEFDLEHGYAVDIVRRPRSTGSILKPFLYAAMLQDGELLPNMLVPDIPTRFDGYAPKNFDRAYRGAVSAKVALAQSLNVPAVRMLKKYGVGRFHRRLRELGMTTLHRNAEGYGLTLILGGAEASLWDLAAMYAGLARSAAGVESPRRTGASPLTAVRDSPPRGAARSETGGLSAATAWLTLDALTEVNRPSGEGEWKSFASSREIAWKTGTSYGLRDAWAVGVTPTHTVAVWVGNANGEGRAGLSGVSTAAPVLFDLFGLLDRTPFFEEPREEMKPALVCIDDGYLASELCDATTEWIPRESRFAEVTPFHRRVHLDPTRLSRVDSSCEDVGRMRSRGWFVLPSEQEFHYRAGNPRYRELPPFRKGCGAAAEGSDGPIAMLYPERGASIWIPTDLEGARGRVVLEAVHRNRNAVLYWHLDDEYLGRTQDFHQLAIEAGRGSHRITIVDQEGHRATSEFEILAN